MAQGLRMSDELKARTEAKKREEEEKKLKAELQNSGKKAQGTASYYKPGSGSSYLSEGDRLNERKEASDTYSTWSDRWGGSKSGAAENKTSVSGQAKDAYEAAAETDKPKLTYTGAGRKAGSVQDGQDGKKYALGLEAQGQNNYWSDYMRRTYGDKMARVQNEGRDSLDEEAAPTRDALELRKLAREGKTVNAGTFAEKHLDAQGIEQAALKAGGVIPTSRTAGEKKQPSAQGYEALTEETAAKRRADIQQRSEDVERRLAGQNKDYTAALRAWLDGDEVREGEPSWADVLGMAHNDPKASAEVRQAITQATDNWLGYGALADNQAVREYLGDKFRDEIWNPAQERESAYVERYGDPVSTVQTAQERMRAYYNSGMGDVKDDLRAIHETDPLFAVQQYGGMMRSLEQEEGNLRAMQADMERFQAAYTQQEKDMVHDRLLALAQDKKSLEDVTLEWRPDFEEKSETMEGVADTTYRMINGEDADTAYSEVNAQRYEALNRQADKLLEELKTLPAGDSRREMVQAQLDDIRTELSRQYEDIAAPTLDEVVLSGYLSVEERETYNYLYRTEGRDAANEYLDRQKNAVYKGYTDAQLKELDEWLQGSGWRMLSENIKTMFTGTADPLNLLSYMMRTSRGELVSPNDPIFLNTHKKQETREQTAEALANISHPELGEAGNNALRWLATNAYQLVSSGMDQYGTMWMAAVPVIGQALATGTLASQAGMAAIMETLEAGGFSRQAAARGMVTAICEFSTEQLGMERVVEAFAGGKLGEKFAGELAKSMLAEALEEVPGNVVDKAFDAWYSGENSEREQNIADRAAALMEQGMARSEALKQATCEVDYAFIQQTATEALMAGLSAGLTQAGSYTIGNVAGKWVRYRDERSAISKAREAVQKYNENEAARQAVEALSRVEAGNREEAVEKLTEAANLTREEGEAELDAGTVNAILNNDHPAWLSMERLNALREHLRGILQDADAIAGGRQAEEARTERKDKKKKAAEEKRAAREKERAALEKMNEEETRETSTTEETTTDENAAASAEEQTELPAPNRDIEAERDELARLNEEETRETTTDEGAAASPEEKANVPAPNRDIKAERDELARLNEEETRETSTDESAAASPEEKENVPAPNRDIEAERDELGRLNEEETRRQETAEEKPATVNGRQGLEAARENGGQAGRMLQEENARRSGIRDQQGSKESFTPETIEENKKTAANAEPVIKLTGNPFSNSGKNLLHRIMDVFKEWGGKAQNAVFGTVTLGESGARHLISQGITNRRASLIPAIKSVIEQGHVVYTEDNHKGKGFDTAVIAAPVTLDGDGYYMGVVVKQTQGKNNAYYMHDAIVIEANEKTGNPTQNDAVSNGTRLSDSRSVFSVLQELRDYNSKNGDVTKIRDITGDHEDRTAYGTDRSNASDGSRSPRTRNVSVYGTAEESIQQGGEADNSNSGITLSDEVMEARQETAEEEERRGVFAAPAVADGGEVQVTGIAQTQAGGGALVEVTDGAGNKKTLPMARVDFGSAKQEGAYAAAMMYRDAETARAFLGVFEQESLPLETIERGFAAAYRAGRNQNERMLAAVRELSPEAARAAYEAGVKSLTNENERIQLGEGAGKQIVAYLKKLFKDKPWAKTQAGENYSGVSVGSGVKLTDAQTVQAYILDQMGRKYGIHFNLTSGLGENVAGVYVKGSFEGGNNLVMLNVNDADANLTRAAGHEVGHLMTDYNAEYTGVMRDIVFKAMEDAGYNLEEGIAQKQEEYGKAGIELSREQAEEEVFADSLFDLFTNEEMMARLRESATGEQKTVLQKAAEFFKKVIAEIRTMFQRAARNNPEVAAVLRADSERMNQAYKTADMILDAYRAEMEARQAQGAEEVNGTPAYSVQEMEDGTPSTGLQIKAREAYTDEQWERIEAYKKAVDTDMVDYFQEAQEGEYLPPYVVGNVSDRMAEDIERITGIDVHGSSIDMREDAAIHIEKRHGKNGQQDHSMSDANDVGRIGYVLSNYDTVTESGTTQAYKNYDREKGKQRGAKTLKFSIAVDGTVHVVEAVTVAGESKVHVITSYVEKNATVDTAASEGAYVLLNAEEQSPPPVPTSENVKQLTPTDSVQQKTDRDNSTTGQEEKYSLVDIDRENENLLAEAQEVRDSLRSFTQAVEKMKGWLSSALGDRKTANAMARSLKGKTGTRVSLKNMTENLNRALQVLADGGKKNVQAAFDMMTDIVRDAVWNAGREVDPLEKRYEGARAELYSLLDKMSAADWGTLAEIVGSDKPSDIKGYLRALGYSTQASAHKETDANGNTVWVGNASFNENSANNHGMDGDYEAVARQYPGLLNADLTNPEDMIGEVLRVLGDNTMQTENDYMDATDANMGHAEGLEAATERVTLELFSEFIQEAQEMSAEQAQEMAAKAEAARQEAVENGTYTDWVEESREQGTELEETQKALAALAEQTKNAAKKINKLNRENEKQRERLAKRDAPWLEKMQQQKEKTKEKLRKQKEKADARLKEHEKKLTEKLTSEAEAGTLAQYEKNDKYVKLKNQIVQKIDSLRKRLKTPEKAQGFIPEGMQQAAESLINAVEAAGGYTQKSAKEYSAEDAAKLDAARGTGLSVVLLDKVLNAYEEMGRQREAEGAGSLITYDPDMRTDIEELKNLIQAREKPGMVKYGGKGNRLSFREMELLHDIVARYDAAVKNSNELFSTKRRETLEQAGNAALEQMDKHIKTYGAHKLWNRLVQFFASGFKRGMVKPETMFNEMLRGTEYQRIYKESLRKGEGKQVRLIQQGTAKLNELVDKYKQRDMVNQMGAARKSKRRQGATDFTLASGRVLNLTKDEAMEIYALNKREQTNGMTKHLLTGGVQIADRANDVTAEPFVLMAEDIQMITDSLTAEEKAYADEMVAYLSQDVAAWRNEVSRALYGIDKYKESYYIPIQTVKTTTRAQTGQGVDRQMKNVGSSKRLTEGANNAVVIRGLTQTWAAHVEESAAYSAYVLPIEDMVRLINYQEVIRDENGNYIGRGRSARLQMEIAYGKDVVDYVENFMGMLNGTTTAREHGDIFLNNFTSKAKGAAVGANLSVILQQAGAGVRASAEINPKYVMQGIAQGMNVNKAWDELQDYAWIAIEKDYGYLDTQMRGSMLSRNQDTAMNKINDIAGAGAGFMDKLNWGQISKAVIAEQHDLHPEMDVKSEEFKQLCEERFTEVIDRTQVIDSVFQRSAWAMEKGNMQKFTAFMNEPIAQYNMIARGIFRMQEAARMEKGEARTAQMKEGAAMVARNSFAITVSAALTSALAAVVRGARDKEDKVYEEYIDENGNKKKRIVRRKTYWDKVVEQWWPGVVDSISSLGGVYMDIAKGIISGEEVSNDMSMTWVTSAGYLMRNLTKAAQGGDVDWERTGYYGAQVVSNLTGIPFSNVWRDTQAIARTAMQEFALAGTSEGDAWDTRLPISQRLEAAQKNYVYNKSAKTGENAGKKVNTEIYTALMMGEYAQHGESKLFYDIVKAATGSGAKDSALVTKFKTEFAATYPQIEKAATALNNGKFAEYDRIVKELTNKNGKYKLGEKVVDSMIRTAYNALQEKKTTAQEKDFKTELHAELGKTASVGETAAKDALAKALQSGTEAQIKAVVAEAKKQGRTDEEIKSQVTSAYKQDYIEALANGNKSKASSIVKKMVASGAYTEESVTENTLTWAKSGTEWGLYDSMKRGDTKQAAKIWAMLCQWKTPKEMQSSISSWLTTNGAAYEANIRKCLKAMGYSEASINEVMKKAYKKVNKTQTTKKTTKTKVTAPWK